MLLDKFKTVSAYGLAKPEKKINSQSNLLRGRQLKNDETEVNWKKLFIILMTKAILFAIPLFIRHQFISKMKKKRECNIFLKLLKLNRLIHFF